MGTRHRSDTEIKRCHLFSNPRQRSILNVNPQLLEIATMREEKKQVDNAREEECQQLLRDCIILSPPQSCTSIKLLAPSFDRIQ